MIPSYVLQYLWDVDESKLGKEQSKFIIERVLEYGDFEALSWINGNYSREEILETLKESRKISPKTGNFFALYYGIDKNSLLCIQKPFTQKQARF